MTSLAIAFIVALALAVPLTYQVRALGRRIGIVDEPDRIRHLHDQPVARIGGVAVFVAFVAVTVPVLMLGHGREGVDGAALLSLLLAACCIFAIGLWDDVRGLGASTKFLLETLVAAALFFRGVAIRGLSIPGAGTVMLPHTLSFILTVLWIVGITNAFNLIDGADGVAAGSAIFASVAMGVVSLIGGHSVGTLMAFALAGATLGFLFFNFPPASVFLGDCGSLFLGFILAAIGLLTTQTASTTMAVAIPVVSLGLPILDTLLAMARRYLRGERIFNADRGHIHHRLRDIGHSPRQVTLLLYAASAGFALLSLLLVQPHGDLIAPIFLVAGIIIWLGVQRLDMPELLEVGRILRRGLVQRTAIAHNVRVREAVRRMRRASTPHAVIAALEYALDGGEFERAELWIRDELALPFAQFGLITRQDRGFHWRWGEAPSAEAHRWEFRLAARDERRRPITRLSLWHDVSADHVLTDLQLIGTELQPALSDALRRTRVHRERGQAAAATAVAGFIQPSHPNRELGLVR